jgi:hypothetical protein
MIFGISNPHDLYRGLGQVSLALVMIIIIGLPMRAAAQNNDWGALAVDKSNPRHYGWSVRKDDQPTAEEAALEHCNGDCEIVAVLKNQCGAYAQGTGGGYGYALRSSKSAAIDTALANCSGYASECRVAVWACSTSDDSSTAPYSDVYLERRERLEREERLERQESLERQERREREEHRERERYYERSTSSFIDGLSDIQRKALADGCEYRYNAVPSKLRACMNGTGGNLQDALTQGCQIRYSGAPEKLRRCLRD